MRRNKGVLVACMCAALAFAIGSDATIATAGPGTKASAKKRCTKKHASKKKKKRCNRNRKSDATRSPVIRATLTWGNGTADDVNMDLFVFDADGNVAGSGSDTIPMSSITPDLSGRAGFEQFTDSLFFPQAARDLSFGVCYSARVPARTDFTLTYVTADGVVHGDSQSPDRTTRFDYPGGAPIPTGFCSR